mgnify:CR=1 FL=1
MNDNVIDLNVFRAFEFKSQRMQDALDATKKILDRESLMGNLQMREDELYLQGQMMKALGMAYRELHARESTYGDDEPLTDTLDLIEDIYCQFFGYSVEKAREHLTK